MTDVPTLLTSGNSMEGSIDLTTGASGVKVNVTDNQGRLVQELIAGPQLPGTMPVVWNGRDAANNPVPTGMYRLSATAVVNGKTETVPVSTLATVRAVSTNPANGSVSVEIEGGKSMLLSDIKRVGL
jgi:flagellar basal-body rod modification protein FlgD